ncbi:40-residue YVTN family beta-propeller repeat-containing protein [Aneurinibacillus migulanus]|uniref:40-residue YVTN family beta-propeller repeat-containing protein n=1 Tax=Aneurinibacillus migulanus TaxID=47500 RepID=A0A1G8LBF9_ANEMI|nr:hypothetical protein AMI01nite_19540 [Aneurinibacillus migulanus]SDI53032.1 40-residue YVTN family beta-propeller repeat-containing protein [Aneurinibacillus migulanus]
MAIVYVTNVNSNTVSVINTVSNRDIATIPVGKDPAVMAITPTRLSQTLVNRHKKMIRLSRPLVKRRKKVTRSPKSLVKHRKS